MAFNAKDKIVLEITSGCTDYSYMCCLTSDPRIIPTFLDWIGKFGSVDAMDLVDYICKCNVAPPPPPTTTTTTTTTPPTPPPPLTTSTTPGSPCSPAMPPPGQTSNGGNGTVTT